MKQKINELELENLNLQQESDQSKIQKEQIMTLLKQHNIEY